MKRQWITALTIMALSFPAFADVQLKSGQMQLFPFLEMVSEKLNIQIDASGLSGGENFNVTIPEIGSVSPERAKEVVLTALHLGGYTWVHNPAIDLYRVVRERDARDQEIPVITDASQLPDSDLLVTYIFSLSHADPDYIARTLRSFMPAASRIIPDVTTSSVLISDSAHNIGKLLQMLKQLDTPEAAKEAKAALIERSKLDALDCPPDSFESRPMSPAQSWIVIALFSVIALVIGFLIRGYVIRRIEGGL